MIVQPHSILLDAEALSSLAAGERRMQAWAAVAQRTDSILHASTVTLAEVTDGTLRDTGVRRTAKALQLDEVTEEIGYRAGRLRTVATASRRKPRDLTVDAVVAATALALRAPVVVLTSDRHDPQLLLTGTSVKVEAIG